MSPKDISDLLIYSARYAIGRHTYASGEVARLVTKFASVIYLKDKAVLIYDIEQAFQSHEVDEYSTQDWKDALDALKSDKVTSEPRSSQGASSVEDIVK